MSYFVLPGQLGAEPTGRAIYPCWPDQVPHTMPDGGPSCYAAAIKPCPPGTEPGPDPHVCIPVRLPIPATPAWVYWARAGGILAGVGVLVGLAWYSTKGSKGSMRQNPDERLAYKARDLVYQAEEAMRRGERYMNPRPHYAAAAREFQSAAHLLLDAERKYFEVGDHDAGWQANELAREAFKKGMAARKSLKQTKDEPAIEPAPETQRSVGLLRANHAPPGWAGSKRAPSRDDWVVVWIFENGTSSEGRFERYVSQDEIVAWSRPLLNSGLVSIMLTRPKDRSVVWSWKAHPGLV